MIALLIPAYFVIGSLAAWYGMSHGWDYFATQFVRWPDTLLILLFWPIYVALYGAASYLQWIDNLARSTRHKENS